MLFKRETNNTCSILQAPVVARSRSCPELDSGTTTLNQRKPGGFTLIELLVVIAIISLLASMVVSAVSGMREKAKISRIAMQLRALESSFNLVYDRLGCWPNSNSAGAECSGTAPYGWFVSSIYAGNIWNLREYVSGNIQNFATFEAVPGSTYSYGYYTPLESSNCAGDDVYDEGASIFFTATPDVYEKLEKIFDGTTSNFYARSARSCGRIQTDATSAATSSLFIFYKLGANYP